MGVPIHLGIDGRDFLPRYDFPQVIKHENDSGNVPRLDKAARNFCRCLELVPGQDALIFEDDLSFHKNWWRDFNRCRECVERFVGPDAPYVISIANHPQGVPRQEYSGEPFTELLHKRLGPTEWLVFSGLYGVFFPSRLNTLMLSLANLIESSPGIPHDLVLGGGFLQLGIRVFYSKEPLVSHVGYSSWIGTTSHTWNNETTQDTQVAPQ